MTGNRRIHAFLLALPFLLRAVLCPEVAAQGVPLSDVPEAQTAYDESVVLWNTNWRAAVERLHDATRLDPDFLHAHALLSERYAWIYQQYDRADSIAQSALAFAESAMGLDPEADVSLSAMGAYHYRIHKDYVRALEIYTRGAELHPTNLVFVRMQAHVARRKGDWAGAMTFLNRAEAMEPSLPALQAIIENHRYNRRWEDAYAASAEYARRAPQSTLGPSSMAWIPFYDEGDTRPLRDFLATRPTGWAEARWNVEMLDRDYPAALEAMDTSAVEVFVDQYSIIPRSMYRGIALKSMGDEAASTAALTASRATLEAMLPELEEDCRVHAALAENYALLGMREEALRAAMRAIALIPPEKDALVGPYNVISLARVYAILGDAEAAAERLAYLLSIPSAVTLPWLRMGPEWDAIRAHPAFQSLVSG